jgi:hypothetical protein
MFAVRFGCATRGGRKLDESEKLGIPIAAAPRARALAGIVFEREGAGTTNLDLFSVS